MPVNSEEELDKYINDLSDIDDEGDGSNTQLPQDGGTGDDAGQQQQQQQPVNQQPAGETAQVQDATKQQPGQAQQQQPAQGQQPNQGQQAATAQQLRPLGNGTFADAKGNIVDQQGQIIAPAGVTARIFNKSQRLEARVQQQDATIRELQNSQSMQNAVYTAARNYGLSNEEQATAIDFAGRIKRGDVLGVAKEVVAMAAAAGHNVTEILGSDVGDSIEMRAIRRALDERLGPLQQREQQSQQEAEAERRGREAYNRFVSENDFADIHANDIAQVAQREQCSPQQAYNRLVMFASRNQLDFSQPLGPQIEARQQQLRTQQQQPNGVATSQTKPMPNGASTRSPGVGTQQQPVELASADDDWGSIISQVQRTMGNA